MSTRSGARRNNINNVEDEQSEQVKRYLRTRGMCTMTGLSLIATTLAEVVIAALSVCVCHVFTRDKEGSYVELAVQPEVAIMLGLALLHIIVFMRALAIDGNLLGSVAQAVVDIRAIAPGYHVDGSVGRLTDAEIERINRSDDEIARIEIVMMTVREKYSWFRRLVRHMATWIGELLEKIFINNPIVNWVRNTFTILLNA